MNKDLGTNSTHSEAIYGFCLKKNCCITIRREGEKSPHRAHKLEVGGSNQPLATKIKKILLCKKLKSIASQSTMIIMIR